MTDLQTNPDNHSERSFQSENFWVEDFGLTDYSKVWEKQKILVQKRLDGEIGDGALIGEHFPVITMGRGSHAENLLNPDMPVIEIERGGDVTYHGPGQLVAYPIILLPEGKRDLHRYLRTLEDTVIETLAHYGVKGLRNPGFTGVWVETDKSLEDAGLKKICAIGVAVKRWVTYHGLSLNIDCDLADYSQLNPCGLSNKSITTMQAILQKPFSPNAIKPVLIKNLKILGCNE